MCLVMPGGYYRSTKKRTVCRPGHTVSSNDSTRNRRSEIAKFAADITDPVAQRIFFSGAEARDRGLMDNLAGPSSYAKHVTNPATYRNEVPQPSQLQTTAVTTEEVREVVEKALASNNERQFAKAQQEAKEKEKREEKEAAAKQWKDVRDRLDRLDKNTQEKIKNDEELEKGRPERIAQEFTSFFDERDAKTKEKKMEDALRRQVINQIIAERDAKAEKQKKQDDMAHYHVKEALKEEELRRERLRRQQVEEQLAEMHLSELRRGRSTSRSSSYSSPSRSPHGRSYPKAPRPSERRYHYPLFSDKSGKYNSEYGRYDARDRGGSSSSPSIRGPIRCRHGRKKCTRCFRRRR